MTGKRIAYISLGIIATGLGILGIFLPGLPTTVFILIALWAFSQSSPRLHHWLTKLPILRDTLQEIDRFQKEKNLPLRTKLISQGAAWISCVACTIIFQSLALSIILGLAAISCSAYMASIPTRPATKPAESDSLDS